MISLLTNVNDKKLQSVKPANVLQLQSVKPANVLSIIPLVITLQLVPLVVRDDTMVPI